MYKTTAIKHSIDESTGNTCLKIGEIEDAINFRYFVRSKEVNAVANTSYGYISVGLGRSVSLTSPPWDGGVLLKTVNGDTISLSLDILPEVTEWLRKHNVSVLDNR